MAIKGQRPYPEKEKAIVFPRMDYTTRFPDGANPSM